MLTDAEYRAIKYVARLAAQEFPDADVKIAARVATSAAERLAPTGSAPNWRESPEGLGREAMRDGDP